MNTNAKGKRKKMIRKISAICLTTIFLLSTIAFAIPLTPVNASNGSIVGLWHFDEGTGTTAHDSSGYDNDGTLKPTGSEPTWVDGKFGKALNFDGENDYVSVADSASLDVTQITIEAWISPDTADEGNTIVDRRGTGGPGTPCVYILQFRTVSPYNYLRAVISVGTEYSVEDTTTPIPTGTGVWTHVAMTYDGETLKLWVNGVEVASNSAPSGDINASNQPVTIGESLGYVNYWDGKIDEVRIWNQALTADQIAANYNLSSISIDINPNTLNLKSKGKWITAYITLPSPYSPTDIDDDTLLLNGTIGAEWTDVQNNVLMAKFSRAEVQDLCGEEGFCTLIITGELTNGIPFQGTDTIRVISPPGSPDGQGGGNGGGHGKGNL